MKAQSTLISAKDRICDAALQEFAMRGFDGANVVRIASEAGVSQPSIHYHFKSKKALWEAALTRLRDHLDKGREIVRKQQAGMAPLERLKSSCLLLIEASARSPVIGRIILSEGQTGGERFDWLIRNVLSEHYYDFVEQIETCIELGLIKAHRPHHILMLLHGAAVTQFNVAPLSSALFGEDCRAPDNVAAFSRLYVDTIFAGLLAPDKET